MANDINPNAIDISKWLLAHAFKFVHLRFYFSLVFCPSFEWSPWHDGHYVHIHFSSIISHFVNIIVRFWSSSSCESCKYISINSYFVDRAFRMTLPDLNGMDLMCRECSAAVCDSVWSICQKNVCDCNGSSKNWAPKREFINNLVSKCAAQEIHRNDITLHISVCARLGCGSIFSTYSYHTFTRRYLCAFFSTHLIDLYAMPIYYQVQNY